MPKIYTRSGDGGETGLWGGNRVSKNHPKVRAYGDVDELNSVIGAALASLPGSKTFDNLRRSLGQVQAELFVAGALLATPTEKMGKLAPPMDRIPPEAAVRLEDDIDAMTRDLKPLKKFILPGGSFSGSLFHVARTVCRRAEREVVSLGQKEKIPEGLLIYLNRLSDYLFTVARWVNRKLKCSETPWQGLSA